MILYGAGMEELKKSALHSLSRLSSSLDNIESDLCVFEDIADKLSTLPSDVAKILSKGVKAVLARSFPLKEEVAGRVNSFLRKALKAGLEAEEGLEVIAEALNETSVFYQVQGREKIVEKVQLPDDSEELAEFRMGLRKDLWIDVISDKGKWVQGQIVEEVSGNYKVTFPGQFGSENHPFEWISTSSTRFAPLNSKTCKPRITWRLELNTGSLVDVLDTVNKWYTASIKDVIGDQLFVAFDGWSSKFYEWVPRFSDRIAPHFTHARGGRESGGVIFFSPERGIPEYDDPEGVCAIYRGREWGSFYLVDNMNYFNEIDGFNAILNRLKSKPSVEAAKIVSAIIYKTMNLFAFPFAKIYFFEFQRSVCDCLLGLSDIELRNLSKINLDEINYNVERIIKRVSTRLGVAEIMELFSLNMALKLFRSPIVERRLNGLETINDAVKSVKQRYGSSIWLSPEFVIKWIASNSVLEDIYSVRKGHPELMKRSSEIFKLICGEKELKITHLDYIWDAMEYATKTNDVSTLSVIYKVLDDIAWQLEAEHFDYLFTRLKQIPIVEYLCPTIDMVKELSRFTHKAGVILATTSLEILWNLFQDDNAVSDTVANYARVKFEELIVTYSLKDLRFSWLQRLLESIKSGKAVISCLKLALKILDNYSENSIVEINRSTVIYQLEPLNILFQELALFKTRASALFISNKVSVELADGYIVAHRTSYIDNINERLQFIRYILLNCSDIGLSNEQLDIAWALLFQTAVTSSEQDSVLIWLRSALGGSSSDTCVLKNDVKRYLLEKLLTDLNPTDLSLSALSTLTRCILSANENILLTRNGKDFSFCVLNMDITGLSFIWKVCLDISNPNVEFAAVEFLNALYENLSPQLSENIGDIRQSYISHCFDNMEFLISSAQYDSILRRLSLLIALLDSSERKGFGGARSHGSLLRGKPIQFIFEKKDKKFDVSMSLMDSVWDLKVNAVHATQTPMDQIRLLFGGSELNVDVHSKTLSEIKIKNGSKIFVTTKSFESLQVPLLNGRELVPRMKVVLEEMFNIYASVEIDDSVLPKEAEDDDYNDYKRPYDSDDDFPVKEKIDLNHLAVNDFDLLKNTRALKIKLFTRNDMAKYIKACGASESCYNDSRLTDIFTKYGRTNQYLSLDGFRRFYRDASIHRPTAVWNDLGVHGYRYDLRKETEVIAEDSLGNGPNIDILPRTILSSKKYFHDLFEALELPDGRITDNLWNLLQRLPTNPELMSDLVSLECVHDGNNWDTLLDSKNMFKLLYSLQIIESLIESTESKDGGSAFYVSQKVEWRQKFIARGGFGHLFKILMDRSSQSSLNVYLTSSNANVVQKAKMCLSLLLKTVSIFTVGSITSSSESLLEMLKSVNLLTLHGIDEVEEAPQDVVEIPGAGEEQLDVPKAPKVNNSIYDSISAELQIIEARYMIFDNNDSFVDVTEQIKNHVSDNLLQLDGNHNAICGDPFPGVLKLLEISYLFAGNSKETVRFVENVPGVIGKVPIPVDLPPQLVFSRQLSAHTAQELLSCINFSDLQIRLFEIMAQVSDSNVESKDISGGIVESACALWVAVTLYEESLLEKMVEVILENKKRMLWNILGNNCKRTRIEFAKSLYQVALTCLNSLQGCAGKSFHSILLDLLIMEIPLMHNPSFDPSEYFFLLAKLIQDSCNGICDGKAENFASTLEFLASKLLTLVSSEMKSDDAPDKIIIGVSNLISILVVELPSYSQTVGKHIPNLFNDFLFASGINDFEIGLNFPKCKTKQSRLAVYNLIVKIVEASKDSADIIIDVTRLLSQQLSQITPVSGWDYDPEKYLVSHTGYVGLKNQSSTCYMNSLLQQFFLMPKFRRGVLNLLVEEKDKTDNLLYEIQRMFSFLTLSEKQSYDTLSFCAAYKDENGQPINVRVQQDAQEFFQVVCDRLESQLKSTAESNLLKELFAGKITNQMICLGGCNSVRERDEDYYTVSVNVKNKRNLEESLLEYVSGEILNEVNCDHCKRRADLNKRTVLNGLQDSIIFHLKRFELNFQTFQNEKLNDRFEFPLSINLEPYTKEGVHRRDCEMKRKQMEEDGKDISEEVSVPERYTAHPIDYYEFELSGVLVHTGNAAGGHYFSFIRARKNDPLTIQNTEENSGEKWFEFNDHRISEFTLDRLDAECFGGETITEETNNWGYKSTTTAERFQNAYMLVYERKKLYTSEMDINIPETVSSLAIIDNIRFRQDRRVYSADYFNFILNIMKSACLPDIFSLENQMESKRYGLELIQLVVQFLFQFVVRSSHRLIFSDFTSYLRIAFSKNHVAVEWFLNYIGSDPVLLSDMLLVCRDSHVRSSFVELCVCALTIMAPYHAQDLCELIENVNPWRWKTSSSMVIYNALELLEFSAKHWMRFPEYFKLFVDICGISSEYRYFLGRMSIIHKFGDFYLGSKSPFASSHKKIIEMGNRVVSPDFENLLKVISLCVRSAVVQDINPPSLLPGITFQLQESDRKILLNETFYTQSLSGDSSYIQPIIDIILHWSWTIEEFSISVIHVLLEGIRASNDVGVKPYLQVLRQFVALEDGLQSMRLKNLFSSRNGIIYYLFTFKNQHQKFVYVVLKSILEMCKEVPFIGEYWNSIRSEWDWLDVWFQAYVNRVTYPGMSSSNRRDSKNNLFEHYKSLVELNGSSLKTSGVSVVPASAGEPSPVASVPHNEYFNVGSKRPLIDDLDDVPGVPSLVNSASDDGLDSIGKPDLPKLTLVGAEESAEKWFCSVCTFENPAHLRSCEMCENPKQ